MTKLFDVHARYVHMEQARLFVSQYTDATAALQAEYSYHDEYMGMTITETETLSVNLGAYGLVAEADHFYIPGWSEYEGLPDALVEAGVGIIVEELKVGPFDAPAVLLRLNEGVLSDD